MGLLRARVGEAADWSVHTRWTSNKPRSSTVRSVSAQEALAASNPRDFSCEAAETKRWTC